MQISLRSQLIAGTAAVVGASAIAMTPVTATPLNLPTIKVPSAAQIALAGFDSPISELLDTASWIQYDLVDGNPANVDSNYPWQPYAGLLPEFIYSALPVISQLGYNGLDYINNTGTALNNSAYTLSEAVWNLPSAVITATKQLFSGDFSGAIATLTNATWVPIQSAVSTAWSAVTYIIGNVVTNVTNAAATLPGILKGLVSSVVNTTKLSINAVVAITQQTLAALGAKNFQAAWNTVVDGLFGPVGADGNVTSSLPGVLESMTIGPGIGALGAGNGYQFQSLRMWGEQSQLTVANSLGATWPTASVAAPKSAAAKVSRGVTPAAAVAAAAAPAAGSASGASAATAGSTSSSSAAPKAAAKHGVSRKAAAAS